MANSEWIQHVKLYQKKHGCTYREAMTLSKATYAKKKKVNVKVKKVIQEDQQGEGIQEIYQSVKSNLLNKLTKRPLVVTNLLNKYGANTITNIQVCRQPIMGIIRSALNVATGGDISKVVKEKGYDNVFHLFCIVTLSDGTRIRMDKNQRLSIAINPGAINADAICKEAKLPAPTTLTSFIEKGEKLGDSIGSFYRYSAHDNNCQKFIKALLNASGIQSLDTFIMQDAGALVKPGLFRTIAQGITDVAALADYTIKGGKRTKIKKHRGVPK